MFYRVIVVFFLFGAIVFASETLIELLGSWGAASPLPVVFVIVLALSLHREPQPRNALLPLPARRRRIFS